MDTVQQPTGKVPAPSSTRKWKIPHLRWLIAFVLFLAAVLNYFDRSVLGLLASTIQKDLALTEQQYATVVNCFLVAYAIAFLVSGPVIDRLGVRVGMALSISWWSISNALTGLAGSVGSLSAFRFMLGLGEASGFTAMTKAVSEWFPPSERGIAVGVYSSGAAVGATIAPILVAVIASHYGWRWVFAISPLLAGSWLVLWLWLYRPPGNHPNITEKERTYLAVGLNSESACTSVLDEKPIKHPWKHILGESYVWRLILARFLTDPVWYFYQFWMPKYLHSVRSVDQKGMSIMWIIFLGSDLGYLMGGFLSGHLIKRGIRAPAARTSVMLVSAILVPLSLIIPFMPSAAGAVLIGMIVVYAHTSWLGSLTSLIIDLTPRPMVGTAFGLIACGSALGGIFMNQAVAWLISHRSYDDCFFVMAILHPLALVVVWKLRRSSCTTQPIRDP